MPCPFCEIVERRLSAEFVYEDECSAAFLDTRPLFAGHMLLVPREHYEALSDVPPETIAPLFRSARLLARAVESGFGAEGSFVAINNRVSQSVPHLHVHIVPRRRGDGLKGFFWPRRSYKGSELQETGERLRAAISEVRRSGA